MWFVSLSLFVSIRICTYARFIEFVWLHLVTWQPYPCVFWDPAMVNDELQKQHNNTFEPLGTSSKLLTRQIPSGKQTVCCWKMTIYCIVSFPIKKMVIFHSCVKLPEGNNSLSTSQVGGFCWCSTILFGWRSYVINYICHDKKQAWIKYPYWRMVISPLIRIYILIVGNCYW